MEKILLDRWRYTPIDNGPYEKMYYRIAPNYKIVLATELIRETKIWVPSGHNISHPPYIQFLEESSYLTMLFKLDLWLLENYSKIYTINDPFVFPGGIVDT